MHMRISFYTTFVYILNQGQKLNSWRSYSTYALDSYKYPLVFVKFCVPSRANPIVGRVGRGGWEDMVRTQCW